MQRLSCAQQENMLVSGKTVPATLRHMLFLTSAFNACKNTLSVVDS